MEKIAQGAEAVIYKNEDEIVKDRLTKGYRHPSLDNSLRKFRTRREAKVLDKLKELNFPAPILNRMCDKEMRINMEFIEGNKLRDVLHNDHELFSAEIGKKLALLHANDLIHGDLTTSNMILSNNNIKFIDFGLSFFSNKVEDKAVDIHLLRQALESKHYLIWESCFQTVIDSYKEHYPEANLVLTRLEQVEKRGRNKH